MIELKKGASIKIYRREDLPDSEKIIKELMGRFHPAEMAGIYAKILSDDGLFVEIQRMEGPIVKAKRHIIKMMANPNEPIL